MRIEFESVNAAATRWSVEGKKVQDDGLSVLSGFVYVYVSKALYLSMFRSSG